METQEARTLRLELARFLRDYQRDVRATVAADHDRDGPGGGVCASRDHHAALHDARQTQYVIDVLDSTGCSLAFTQGVIARLEAAYVRDAQARALASVDAEALVDDLVSAGLAAFIVEGG